MATTKATNRSIRLDLRRAKVTSLNLTTEKHGKDNQVPRVDVSLTFLVSDVDIPDILDCKNNPLQALWHSDKTPALRELQGAIKLSTQAQGTLKLGLTDELAVAFDDAILKSVSIKPLMKLEAEIKCQVRVDPSDRLELLEDLLVATEGVFAFEGEGIKNEKKDANQGDLDV